MAYQSVGTPRFWVSTLQWLNSKGLLYWNNTSFSGANLNLFNLNPVNGNVLTGGATADDYFAINAEYGFQNIMINDNNFYMVLGHNFGSIGLTNLFSTGTLFKTLEPPVGLVISFINLVNNIIDSLVFVFTLSSGGIFSTP